MKQFVGYLLKKAAGKGKVSPTIKSVKPTTKSMKKSVDVTKLDQTIKNIDLVNKLKRQKVEGIKSARKHREIYKAALKQKNLQK